MKISIINDLAQFELLKSDWDVLYSADPHAQVFLSWAWLYGWAKATPDTWFVLAIQLDKNSPYVAFFPLAIRTVKKYGRWLRELHLGGASFADYTGFVCLPEYEEKAISTVTVYIQEKLKWDIFLVLDVSDPRLDIFLECFLPENFNIQPAYSYTSSCPYISLPATWEQYLCDFLGSETRQNLRRKLKHIERLDKFRFTQAQEENLEHQIEALLTLWQMRRGAKSEVDLNIYRSIFRQCFEQNCLWLNVLWQETIPIAGIAVFVDRKLQTFSFYITGFDPNFSKISPGRVVIAHSIKYAIENGFKIYDFLRGSEDYKVSFFGAKEKRFNQSVAITRKSLQLNVLLSTIDVAIENLIFQNQKARKLFELFRRVRKVLKAFINSKAAP